MSIATSQNNEIAFSHNNLFPGQPTLVFLHDSLGCIELWRDFPEKLARKTNCNFLVYDRLGYGKSGPFRNFERENDYLELEADFLAGLLKKQAINDAILFGHSDGGSIALIAAAKYPDTITAVITEGAHIFVEDETINGIRAAIEAYQATNLKAKLEKYHGTKTEALFHAWADTWTSATFRNWNIEHFLPNIVCPVLVIQGEADEYGTTEQVNGITQQVTGKAKSLLLAHVKHSPHKEAPDAVLSHCVSFIKQLTGL